MTTTQPIYTKVAQNHSDFCAQPGCAQPRRMRGDGKRGRYCMEHELQQRSAQKARLKAERGQKTQPHRRKYDTSTVLGVLPHDDWTHPADPTPDAKPYPVMRWQRGKLRRLVLGRPAAYTDYRTNQIVIGRVAIDCVEPLPNLDGNRRRRMIRLYQDGYVVRDSEL